MKEIKKQFMIYRNGVVADTLRRAFSQAGENPYHIIFGLNLPQLSQIAREVEPERRAALATELWADRHVRESRLLACYLLDPSSLAVEDALALVQDLQTLEEADILCMRVLGRMSDRAPLVAALQQSTAPLSTRCLHRLQQH